MNIKEIKTKDLRQFGVVLGVILGFAGLIQYLRGSGNIYPWFWTFAGISLAAAIFAPRGLSRIYTVFMKIAHAIGWFNTRVILILVYYLVLTPIGILMRIFGKDPLSKTIDKGAASYWIEREVFAVAKENMEKQF